MKFDFLTLNCYKPYGSHSNLQSFPVCLNYGLYVSFRHSIFIAKCSIKTTFSAEYKSKLNKTINNLKLIQIKA